MIHLLLPCAGVTALNIEAMHVMKRGMAPSGVNPFPVSVPLQGQLPAGQSVSSSHNGGTGRLELF